MTERKLTTVFYSPFLFVLLILSTTLANSNTSFFNFSLLEQQVFEIEKNLQRYQNYYFSDDTTNVSLPNNFYHRSHENFQQALLKDVSEILQNTNKIEDIPKNKKVSSSLNSRLYSSALSLLPSQLRAEEYLTFQLDWFLPIYQFVYKLNYGGAFEFRPFSLALDFGQKSVPDGTVTTVESTIESPVGLFIFDFISRTYKNKVLNLVGFEVQKRPIIFFREYYETNMLLEIFEAESTEAILGMTFGIDFRVLFFKQMNIRINNKASLNPWNYSSYNTDFLFEQAVFWEYSY